MKKSTEPESVAFKYTRNWIQQYHCQCGTNQLIKQSEMECFHILASEYIGIDNKITGLFLDIGSCTGRYLDFALNNGFNHIIGIDSSLDAVCFLRKRYSDTNIEILHLDVTSDDFSNKSFERKIDIATIMFGTINHITCLQQTKLLRKLWQCLTKNGSIVISSWLPKRCNFSLYTTQQRAYLARGIDTIEYFSKLAIETKFKIVAHKSTPELLLIKLKPN